jgi:hypothetical protein
MLNRLAIVPRCFAALWGSRRWQNGLRSTIPSLAVIGRYFFERPALTPRVARGRAKPVPFAGSNPFDATRWNACAPLQALAVWIASRRLSKTKRARKAQ